MKRCQPRIDFSSIREAQLRRYARANDMWGHRPQPCRAGSMTGSIRYRRFHTRTKLFGLRSARFWSMAESRLPEPWAELQSALQALRTEFPGSDADHAARALFDEFVAEGEFWLALETLCDSLLESEGSMITSQLLAAISRLHAKMRIDDNCVTLLRRKVVLPDEIR